MPTPKPRHTHVNGDYLDDPRSGMYVTGITEDEDNGWLCHEDMNDFKLRNLHLRPRLWRSASMIDNRNAWLPDNSKQDFPEQSPLNAFSALPRHPNGDIAYNSTGQQVAKSDEQHLSWLPTIDMRERSTSYEKEDVPSSTNDIEKRFDVDDEHNDDRVIRRPPFQADSSFLVSHQMRSTRPSIPKMWSKYSIQLLPNQTSTQSAK